MFELKDGVMQIFSIHLKLLEAFLYFQNEGCSF